MRILRKNCSYHVTMHHHTHQCTPIDKPISYRIAWPGRNQRKWHKTWKCANTQQSQFRFVNETKARKFIWHKTSFEVEQRKRMKIDWHHKFGTSSATLWVLLWIYLSLAMWDIYRTETLFFFSNHKRVTFARVIRGGRGFRSVFTNTSLTRHENASLSVTQINHRIMSECNYTIFVAFLNTDDSQTERRRIVTICSKCP